MPQSYGQFCTVARAMEILGERWSVLLIREILLGSERFEDIRRGVPRISRTMLTQRLKTLVDAGVVERVPREPKGHVYGLTPMGRELSQLVELVGVWGRRWLAPQPTPEQLDPDFLLWDIRRGLPADPFDRPRALVRFRLADLPPDRRVHYLHFERTSTSWCAVNPGFDVDVELETDVATLARIWLGDLEPARAQRLQWTGDRDDIDRLKRLLHGGYAFASVQSAAK